MSNFRPSLFRNYIVLSRSCIRTHVVLYSESLKLFSDGRIRVLRVARDRLAGTELHVYVIPRQTLQTMTRACHFWNLKPKEVLPILPIRTVEDQKNPRAASNKSFNQIGANLNCSPKKVNGSEMRMHG
jgi:hypothetical protein